MSPGFAAANDTATHPAAFARKDGFSLTGSVRARHPRSSLAGDQADVVVRDRLAGSGRRGAAQRDVERAGPRAMSAHRASSPIKEYRRIATRYDELAACYLAYAQLATHLDVALKTSSD
jgi:hypothetical protein